MGKELLTYDDLLQIVELIKSAETFSEFHLKIGEIELDLRKASAPVAAGTHAAMTVPSAAAAPPPSRPTESTPAVVTPASHAEASRQPATDAHAPAVDIPAGAVVIKSPMVGTFYLSPEPGARPFVEVGQLVKPETTVCIIEVMKLMNSIPAGCTGTVTHVLVGDAQPVEFGQLLIVIAPQG